MAFPPPPSSPSASASFPEQRPRQQPAPPPLLRTSLEPPHRLHLAAQTPASAVHASSPFSASLPGSAQPGLTSPTVTRISPSTMNTYNPQEWGRTSSVSGQYVPHAAAAAQARARGTREATGMEASLPSPPPPYTASASASPQVSSPRTFQAPTAGAHFMQALSSSPVQNSTATTTEFPTPTTVTSPVAPMNFPPPPGSHRDRSGSRTRGVLTNIAAFASSRSRQPESSSPATATDLSQRQRSDSSTARQPGTPFRSTFGQIDQSNFPPTARRSASVGVTPPAYDLTRDGLTQGGAQGMPLPGPPPGPPPPNSRSQSMNRVYDRSMNTSPDPSILAPIPTRAARGSNLGPVPPTPADWVDEDDPASRPSNSAPAPLRLETQSTEILGSSNGQFTATSQLPSASALEPGIKSTSPSIAPEGLAQTQVKREPSLSIRDRRSESRARSKEPQSAVEPGTTHLWTVSADETKPANLVLSSSNSSGIGRRRHVAKAQASPRSAQFSPPGSSAGPTESLNPYHGAKTSPLDQKARPATSPQQTRGPSHGASFPPEPGSGEREDGTRSATNTTPKSIPTPSVRDSPLQLNTARSGRQSASQLGDSPLSGSLGSAAIPSAKFDGFAQASFERFQKFLVNEMAAADDWERLELFAQFAVHESRLRRDRYSQAFEAMGSDVLDLTRDLWRSFANSNKRAKAIAVNTGSEVTKVTSGPPSRSETGTPVAPSSGSSPGSAAFTPMTEPDSPGISTTSNRGSRSEMQRQGSFQPILSPIPSMAMSTIPDESGSRGRSASRWWESESGSIGAAGRKIERTKRESKYMGLPREAREHLQWETAELSPSYNIAGSSNQYQSLGPNEYPPEKVGWHEETTPSKLGGFAQTPSTPQPRGLDVSRLITLPPPYPRHHPAVNNSHPELASIRAALHSLNDPKDAARFFEQFATDHPAMSPGLDLHSFNERRRERRMSIQGRIATGEISFAEAAKEETDFEESEAKRQQDACKKSFDAFQAKVVKPLQSIYNARIAQASSSLNSLRMDLLDEATQLNPNHAQEEGDEQPETLEKITLMKWFFEAREKLHKDAFELQNQSDEKYKHVILAPYRVVGNTAKIQEVEDFFAKDARDRRLAFSTDALKRFETFLLSVEKIVTRGVEAQLSAFWDIAPNLLAVVQKVPSEERELHTFEVMIPSQELVENPPYHEFPLQYLYTLLLHAEKSAYQFIESQTNLLCLLHEVKSGLMLAHCKVLEDQRTLLSTSANDATESEEDVMREMQAVREEEDRRLTRELQERVDVVEDQWRSALGTALASCKQHVGAFLENIGGWDESLVE